MPSFDGIGGDALELGQDENGTSNETAFRTAHVTAAVDDENEEDSNIFQMGNIKRKKKNSLTSPPKVEGGGGDDKDGKAGGNKRNSWRFSISLMSNGSGGGAAADGKAVDAKKGGGKKSGGKKKGNDAESTVIDDEDAFREQLMDAGETDGTQDIPEEYRDIDGNFKMMPVPRHLGSLTRRRPPLVAVMGVAGCGKSRLASALLGREKEKEHRRVFGVGEKTVLPKVVVGEQISVLDTPGLPDPLPRVSDTYYNATVEKLRSTGYANVILFVVNQERVTPTLIKNYGLLYRAFNRLDCVKAFVLRRETSFLLLNQADQRAHEKESRRTVNQILSAANLKSWSTQQFFMLTAGSGEEQDKQLKYMRELVKKSPRIDITPGEGLRLTSEVKTEDVDAVESEGEGKSSPKEGRSSSRSTSRGRRKRSSKKKEAAGSGVSVISPSSSSSLSPPKAPAKTKKSSPTKKGAKDSECCVM